jgi:hypothetical protein
MKAWVIKFGRQFVTSECCINYDKDTYGPLSKAWLFPTRKEAVNEQGENEKIVKVEIKEVK